MNNDNDMLSQEEIDALMNNNDDSALTEEEKDVLGEIGNIAMGSSATALYTLLDQKVEITTPEVKVLSFAEIIKQYERPCVLVKVRYIAGLEGVNLLIINEKDAAVIADLMMGGDGTNKVKKLDEIHISAVGEAMNQMMGSAATSLSSIIDNVVNISPPETDYLDLNDVFNNEEKYFNSDDLLVDTSFRFKIGTLIDSSFKQISPIKCTKELTSRLMNIETGGLTAKNDIDQQEVLAKVKDENQEQLKFELKRQEGAHNMTGNLSKDESVGVKMAHFPDFNNNTSVPLPQNMELIQDVPLQVAVCLGKSKLIIKEILDLGEGSIIELDKMAGEPVDLFVNGKLIAKGEVVVINENFGFRVKNIINPVDRLDNI